MITTYADDDNNNRESNKIKNNQIKMLTCGCINVTQDNAAVGKVVASDSDHLYCKQMNPIRQTQTMSDPT